MNKYESKYFNTARRMDDALVSLLLEKEFEYITIKEICARAAVNRSTFYLHYENTADLLAETVEMTRERFLNSVSSDDTVQSAIENAPVGDLFFITDQQLLPYLNFIRENRHIYKAMHTQMDIFGVEHAYSQLFQNVFSPRFVQIRRRRRKARLHHDLLPPRPGRGHNEMGGNRLP